MTQMDFIEVIKSRGFVHQMTDEKGLEDLLKTPGQRAYIGFDCTAKSLHVGSLLQIMLLRWWQKCGHTPIVLLGGGTTKIGDPSGKDESRPPLTDAQIQENMDSLKQVFAEKKLPNGETCGFIKFDSATNAGIMVNNDDWLSGLNYPKFLRDYGRHFSVNRMLTMDSVKLRLEREQPLSFLEFNYMILQAYDFVELNRRLGCRVQMGGSDQWGNIINGVELQRRVKGFDGLAVAGKPHNHTQVMTKEYGLFGITSPLITTSSGAKMGKTAAGAIWLNADLCAPYDYWQFWRNTEDGDVIRFLKLFTELPLEQIAEYESWVGSARINEAKIILATEATALLHGREAAEKAKQTAADTFSGAGISAYLPEITLAYTDFPPEGWPLTDLLVRANFVSSKGEAKKLIEGNGARINDQVITDVYYRLMAQAITPAKPLKLSRGKKQHVLVKLA